MMIPNVNMSRPSLLLGAGAAATAFGLSACTSPSAQPTTPSGSGSAPAGGKLQLMLLGPTETLVTHMNSTLLPAFNAELHDCCHRAGARFPGSPR